MECVGPITCTWHWLSENMTVVFAICAMAITIWQGYLTRRHSRLSVKPHLTIDYTYSNHDFSLEYRLSNNGLGPAIITKYEMIIDEKVVPTDNFNEAKQELWHLFNGTMPNFASQLKIRHINNGEALEAGKDLVLLDFSRLKGIEPDLFNYDLIATKMAQIKFKVQYESFYGEKSPQLVF